LVVSGAEEMAKGTPEKTWDGGLGCIYTKNKSHNYWMNTDPVVIPGGRNLTAAGARCCGEQTLQRPAKAGVE
jgi:hypothetical protein